MGYDLRKPINLRNGTLLLLQRDNVTYMEQVLINGFPKVATVVYSGRDWTEWPREAVVVLPWLCPPTENRLTRLGPNRPVADMEGNG